MLHRRHRLTAMQTLRPARGFERHLPHAPSMPSALQPYRLHPNRLHRSPLLATCDFRRSSSDRSCSTRAEAANSAPPSPPPPPAAAARSSAISKFAAAANAPISVIECTGHEAGRGVRSAAAEQRGRGDAGLGVGRCERPMRRPDRAVPLWPLPEGASVSASTSERDLHACGR
jgi:hypothetical protein